MFCSKCGKKSDGGSNFCTRCGTNMSDLANMAGHSRPAPVDEHLPPTLPYAPPPTHGQPPPTHENVAPLPPMIIYKTNKKAVALTVVACAVIVIAAVIAVFIFFSAANEARELAGAAEEARDRAIEDARNRADDDRRDRDEAPGEEPDDAPDAGTIDEDKDIAAIEEAAKEALFAAFVAAATELNSEEVSESEIAELRAFLMRLSLDEVVQELAVAVTGVINMANRATDESDVRVLMFAGTVAGISQTPPQAPNQDTGPQQILNELIGGHYIRPGTYRVYFDGPIAVRGELHPLDSRSGEHIQLGMWDPSPNFTVVDIAIDSSGNLAAPRANWP